MLYHRGTRTFLVIWAGQAVSMLGTAMTRFALLIWAYQQTGQATTLALLGFFSFAVYVTLAPVAGVWVDRWDRRRVMIASDFGAGLITMSYLLLRATGELHIWHLYAGASLTGLFEAFQKPAYNASMSVLVPRQHLMRANGLRSLSYDATNVLGPVLGGLLLSAVGLNVIMLVDVGTFCVAAVTLLAVRIPRPAVSQDGVEVRGLGFRQELAFGTRYIVRRPGLLGLTVIFMLIHLFAALAYFSILPAMILARSGGNELVLSSVQSALGVGGVVGGLMMAIWGGPRRKIHSVLGFCAASFLCGDLLFAVGRTPLMWVVAAFAAAVYIPFISSANRAIWQTKVPPDVQGRVLGAAFAWQQITSPLGYLVAGPLADYVFEPAMVPGGALSGMFGGLVGTGPGAGMGLIFLGTATFGTLACLGGYLFPALRNVETDLPDYVYDVGAAALEATGD
jgi:DHA3 family macrolide efflux protein-like MFS transporter